MTKYVQNEKDLTEHLKDQISFMTLSGISFDNGFEGEAKRLTVAIRILVHDATHSSSLLTQLNKMDMLFYDSASSFDPRNLLTSNCLSISRLSKKEGQEIEGNYVAPLEFLPPGRSKDKKVGFDRWWRRNTIIKDREKNEFSRHDLVLTVANKEGGAHIDPQLDEAYTKLSKFNSLGWKVYYQGKDKDFLNSPILPSIRQIAHEVIKTLKDNVIDLYSEDDSIFDVFSKYEEHCTLLCEKRKGGL